jgi:hypothetical protein
VQDEVTSPCIDAGDPNGSLGDELFPHGGIVNLGAYGGTVEASKSYFGQPVSDVHRAGDINGDGRVDLVDLRVVLSQWSPRTVQERDSRISFVTPPDGATLEIYSEPVALVVDVSAFEAVANVVFHIDHATETFHYRGQCQGQPDAETDLWSASWSWAGDKEQLLSASHLVAVSIEAGQTEDELTWWQWSGNYILPEGRYTITAEVTDGRGLTTVSSPVNVTITRKRLVRR